MKITIHRHSVTWLWPAVLGLLLLGSANTQAATDCNAVTEISTVECVSLLELYHSTDGPNWTNNDGWNATNTPCSWYGITCENNGVTQIEFSFFFDGNNLFRGNNLNGTIPDFSGLPNLTRLYLWGDRLTGSIPDFSGLPNLTELWLSGNELTGPIPDFSGLPNLTTLGLIGLTSPIPDFSGLPNLTTLGLIGLTSPIPDFSGLSNLTELQLSQVTSPIPDFSGLPNLTELRLYGLTSRIPDFSGLPNLTTIELDKFTGPIPGFSGLPNLTELRLIGLTGPIPDFSGLPNLTVLSLGGNELTGPIPDFSGLPNLTELSLGGNELTGPIPDFSGLPNLTELSLGGNQLTTVPDFSGLPNLTELSLGGNQLTAVPDFSGLPNLTRLSLEDNQLTGPIPDFSGLPNLTVLSLVDNQLTAVPDFSALPKLEALYIDNNQLMTVPDFSKLPNLQKLHLHGNQLTTVPNFSALSQLQTLVLGNNQLAGPIPDFSGLPNLTDLYLQGNPICRDANINYAARIEGELATFPLCLSFEPVTPSTTLKAGQQILLKSRIQGPIKRAWVEIQPVNKDFQLAQQLPLSSTDNENWEASWSDAFYNGDYQVTFYAEETAIGQFVNSNKELIIHVTEGLPPPQQRLAIVIAGGGNQKDNNLWNDTRTISNAIYAMLRSRRFTDDEIYYLTPEPNADYNGDGIQDNIVDTPSPGQPLTRADIRVALQWAKEQGTLGQPLYLFFTGHGSPAQNGRLALSETEYLYAKDFKDYVNEYQQATSNPVVLLIDACYSGIWAEQLQAPRRAIISSARADELAYFADNDSFNGFLANYLMGGATLYEAFELAREQQNKMVGSHQQSQNPVFGVNDEDNRWIRDIRIGDRLESAPITITVKNRTPGTTLPRAESVTPTPWDDAESGMAKRPIGESVTLTAWADAESGMANSVWALIRPPGMNPVVGTYGTPILPFQRIELSPSEGQLWTGVWNEAVYNGDYEITFYAKDEQGYLDSSDTFLINRFGGIEPPAQARVQIVLEKEQYRLGEPFKAQLIEDLGWGYDLYAAVVMPDGQFLALKHLNDLAALNQPQNWLTPRTQSSPATLFELTLPTNLPTGQYCLYGILSPELEDVFKTLEQGLWVMDVRCFDVSH